MTTSTRRERFKAKRQQQEHEASVKRIAQQIDALKRKLQEQKRLERGR